ncbi:MAG: hypothetical protein HQL58_13680 [Magnetococcales bacterium]|nr:hypothetical protein [Magnetococcales bacterium]
MKILKGMVILGALLLLAGFVLLLQRAAGFGDTPKSNTVTFQPVDMPISGHINTIIPLNSGGLVALVDGVGEHEQQELLFFDRKGVLERQIRLIQQDTINRQIALMPTPR